MHEGKRNSARREALIFRASPSIFAHHLFAFPTIPARSNLFSTRNSVFSRLDPFDWSAEVGL